jgi:hypothetical protein
MSPAAAVSVHPAMETASSSTKAYVRRRASKPIAVPKPNYLSQTIIIFKYSLHYFLFHIFPTVDLYLPCPKLPFTTHLLFLNGTILLVRDRIAASL